MQPLKSLQGRKCLLCLGWLLSSYDLWSRRMSFYNIAIKLSCKVYRMNVNVYCDFTQPSCALYFGTEGSNQGCFACPGLCPPASQGKLQQVPAETIKELLFVHPPAICPEVKCVKLCNNPRAVVPSPTCDVRSSDAHLTLSEISVRFDIACCPSCQLPLNRK